MKGVILAGGAGTRLFPLTRVTNKHLLPVGRYPMIVHAVKKFVDAGIVDLMVVTGTEHMGDMITLLGSGKEYGCEFTFKVQDEANGIAGAVKLCKGFVGTDDFVVILGDNIFEDSLNDLIADFTNKKLNIESGPLCMLFLKEVDDPSRFGVASIQDGKITKITEKPDNPETNLCVTGIYFYDHKIFDAIDTIQPSNRHEYEISDVNNWYIDNGSVFYAIMKGWWTDAGTHSSYSVANSLMSKLDQEKT